MIIAAIVISALSVVVNAWALFNLRRLRRKIKVKPIVVHTAQFDDLARKMRAAVKQLPADKRKIS